MSDDDRKEVDGQGGKVLRFASLRDRPERSRPSRYDEAFEKAATRFAAHQSLLERERAAADRLIDQLADLSLVQRQLLIDNSPRFQIWGLAERLIEEAQHHVGKFDSSSQLDLMRTAIAVAENLDPRIYGHYRHRDLQASAWAQLGNALRIAAGYDSAAEAFAVAHGYLDQGTGCATRKAYLESLEVSLLHSLARLGPSLALANRALARLPATDSPLRVKLLHQRAMAEPVPERAIAGFRQVLDQISVNEQPLFTFVVLQALSSQLAEVGRLDEGHEAVTQAGRLVHHAKRWGVIHLEWSSAALAARGGEMTTAVAILSGLWLTFSTRPINDGYLLTSSLDLVDARAASDGPRKTRRLAETIGDLLVQRGYPTTVLNGWSELRRTIALGRLPRPKLDAFHAYFRRAWNDPHAELVLPA